MFSRAQKRISLRYPCPGGRVIPIFVFSLLLIALLFYLLLLSPGVLQNSPYTYCSYIYTIYYLFVGVSFLYKCYSIPIDSRNSIIQNLIHVYLLQKTTSYFLFNLKMADFSLNSNRDGGTTGEKKVLPAYCHFNTQTPITVYAISERKTNIILFFCWCPGKSGLLTDMSAIFELFDMPANGNFQIKICIP